MHSALKINHCNLPYLEQLQSGVCWKTLLLVQLTNNLAHFSVLVDKQLAETPKGN